MASQHVLLTNEMEGAINLEETMGTTQTVDKST